MFTIALHMQTPSLDWLESLAKQLGHIEVAIDFDGPQPPPIRQPHPVVKMVDEAERAEKAMQKLSIRAKLDANAERKRQERLRMAALSPKVIAAVACPTCFSGISRPCCGPSGSEFGFTGHTHFARRQAYKDIKS